MDGKRTGREQARSKTGDENRGQRTHRCARASIDEANKKGDGHHEADELEARHGGCRCEQGERCEAHFAPPLSSTEEEAKGDDDGGLREAVWRRPAGPEEGPELDGRHGEKGDARAGGGGGATREAAAREEDERGGIQARQREPDEELNIGAGAEERLCEPDERPAEGREEQRGHKRARHGAGELQVVVLKGQPCQPRREESVKEASDMDAPLRDLPG